MWIGIIVFVLCYFILVVEFNIFLDLYGNVNCKFLNFYNIKDL